MGGISIHDFESQMGEVHPDMGDLELQLAQVVERDDVTISTSRGMRRKRKTRTTNFDIATTLSNALTNETAFQEVTTDAVRELDRVETLVKAQGGDQPYRIQIRRHEHPRSPFVVSFQHVRFDQRKLSHDEGISVASALESSQRLPVMGASVRTYATLATDLAVEGDPWDTAGQFTPESFDEAYRRVYGRSERFTRVWKDVVGTAVSLFQRVEHVENTVVEQVERAEESVEEALTLVEVPRFSFARALVGFSALALIVTLPANAVALYRTVSHQKDVASAAGQAAVSDVVSAAQAGSLPQSAESLKQASSRFRDADALMAGTSALAMSVASVMPAQYRSARALLEVGDKSTEAARLLALGLDKVFSDPSRRVDERLDVLSAYARSALVLLSDATKAAGTIHPNDIPEAQREKGAELMERLNQSAEAVREFVGLSDFLSRLAGKEHLRKYLVIFQNQTELRPTGGFMGSFAEVTVDKGAIQSVRVPSGGTYELKGQLRARVSSPKPLQLVNALWQFQDANWSPDFPTSAQKIRWFWSKSGQSTIDGVIAVNETFVEKLLQITGPIEMPEYGKTIDASNFLIETQKAVEIEYDKIANTPKKFLGDLMPKLMERLKNLSKEQWLEVAKLGSESLTTKDIQVAMMKPEEESVVEKYGWGGRMKEASGDSLAIIEANIAGQKTDGVITEQVEHVANIQRDGSIVDTVTLTRTHGGQKGELFRGVRNVSYIRTYVPEGSVLLSASGFDTPDAKLFKEQDTDATPDPDVLQIESTTREGDGGVEVQKEGSRTVFGGWVQLDPGQSQTIVLKYRLPFSVRDILAKVSDQPLIQSASERSSSSGRGAYMLLLTSQAGKTSRQVTSTVRVPSSWRIYWSRPTLGSSQSSAVQLSGAWDRDQAIVALLTPQHDEGITP